MTTNESSIALPRDTTTAMNPHVFFRYLRRILLYPEFIGHPLRKDYPAERIQPLVPYREADNEKIAPFGRYEGMPFGRQTHQQVITDGSDPELFPESVDAHPSRSH